LKITQMNSVKLIAAALLLSFTISCANDGGEDATTPTNDTTAKKLAPPASATAPATNTSVALNPAHGQPGHRCDIAVGAPLNSAPAPTVAPANQPPMVAQPAPTTMPAPSGSGTGAKNPAHGQPGHRCDIAVGAPLN
jgi:hypothetical protein